MEAEQNERARAEPCCGKEIKKLSGGEGARTGVEDPGGRTMDDEDKKTEAAIRKENQQHNKDVRY